MSGGKSMSEIPYKIPVQIGHSPTLRFRLAPVSKKIMSGDADWIDSKEFCVDNICGHEFLLPFVEQFLPDQFLFRNEINLMPFSNASRMSEEIRKTASLLKTDYSSPALAGIKKHFSLDLLVSGGEYNQKYLLLSGPQKAQAVRDRIGIVIDFYMQFAGWLDSVIAEYEPKDFHQLAITSPA